MGWFSIDLAVFVRDSVIDRGLRDELEKARVDVDPSEAVSVQVPDHPARIGD